MKSYADTNTLQLPVAMRLVSDEETAALIAKRDAIPQPWRGSFLCDHQQPRITPVKPDLDH